MSTVEKPIMVRAKISADEWATLRMEALRTHRPVAEIVGTLIRDHLASEENNSDK